MPRRFYKDKEENVKYHINFKLQANRYVGPYRIIAKISPVIYTIDLHGEDTNIHILHMKSAGKTSLKQRKHQQNKQNYMKKIKNNINNGDQNQMDYNQKVVDDQLNNNSEDVKEKSVIFINNHNGQ